MKNYSVMKQRSTKSIACAKADEELFSYETTFDEVNWLCKNTAVAILNSVTLNRSEARTIDFVERCFEIQNS